MGQKTNPIGLRLGIIKGWDSNWYGGKNFGEKLVEDDKIRKYLFARLSKAGVSKIQIERTLKLVTVTIHTARPGIIIGKGGQEVDKLKEELKKLTGKEMQINITEIKRPELDAYLVANNIARQIEGRISFRRAIKTAIASDKVGNKSHFTRRCRAIGQLSDVKSLPCQFTLFCHFMFSCTHDYFALFPSFILFTCMTSKLTSWRKLTQFMTYHIFGYINGDEFITIMDSNGQTHKIRRDD